jgi:phospholipase/carboxylesterase
MNRIQSFPHHQETSFPGPRSNSAELSAGLFSASHAAENCSLFAPLHYESNYAYPLFVWLHGPGDSETQVKRIMPLVSLRNYAAVAVRGTVTCERTGNQAGYAWSQTRSHVALAEQRVFDAIDVACNRFNIGPQRIFLGGFDCGGTMAFRLAMSHPRSFAGVLSLGGEFPAGRNPLGRLSDARRIPVFLAYGRDSQKYPTTSVCENLKLLHSAGMSVALRQYPCGHQISPLMLSDMDRWMMEQITSPAQLSSR